MLLNVYYTTSDITVLTALRFSILWLFTFADLSADYFTSVKSKEMNPWEASGAGER